MEKCKKCEAEVEKVCEKCSGCEKCCECGGEKKDGEKSGKDCSSCGCGCD